MTGVITRKTRPRSPTPITMPCVAGTVQSRNGFLIWFLPTVPLSELEGAEEDDELDGEEGEVIEGEATPEAPASDASDDAEE